MKKTFTKFLQIYWLISYLVRPMSVSSGRFLCKNSKVMPRVSFPFFSSTKRNLIPSSTFKSGIWMSNPMIFFLMLTIITVVASVGYAPIVNQPIELLYIFQLDLVNITKCQYYPLPSALKTNFKASTLCRPSSPSFSCSYAMVAEYPVTSPVGCSSTENLFG